MVDETPQQPMQLPKKSSKLKYLIIIIAIVAIAGVLYALGIFTPVTVGKYEATGFAPFTVLAQGCNATAFYIELGNGAGTAVTLLNASVIASTGLNGVGNSYDMNGISGPNKFITCTSSSPCTALVPSGQSTIIIIPGTCSTSGSVLYNLSMSIWYSETTSLGTQIFASMGCLNGSSSTASADCPR
jgi:hypothetical protein